MHRDGRVVCLQCIVQNSSGRFVFTPFSVCICHYRQCFPVAIPQISLIVLVVLNGDIKQRSAFIFPEPGDVLAGRQFAKQIPNSVNGITQKMKNYLTLDHEAQRRSRERGDKLH